MIGILGILVNLDILLHAGHASVKLRGTSIPTGDAP
jgi:hypothetical protein